jgi:hypothetical protein
MRDEEEKAFRKLSPRGKVKYGHDRDVETAATGGYYDATRDKLLNTTFYSSIK